jgi:hypothetical protein
VTPRHIREYASCRPARRQARLLLRPPGSGLLRAVPHYDFSEFYVTPGSSSMLWSYPGSEGISLALFERLFSHSDNKQRHLPAAVQGAAFYVQLDG